MVGLQVATHFKEHATLDHRAANSRQLQCTVQCHEAQMLKECTRYMGHFARLHNFRCIYMNCLIQQVSTAVTYRCHEARPAPSDCARASHC